MRQLTDKKVIRENHRYATFSAMWGDQRVFVKEARDPRLQEKLRAEAWGLEAFSQLQRSVALPFRTPEIIVLNSGQLITSWVEGSQLVLDPDDENYSEELTFFAKSYAVIDEATVFKNRLATKWAQPTDGSVRIVQNLRRRLSAIDYKEYFDDSDMENGLRYIEERVSQLDARLTHADFTPGNTIVSPDNRTRTLIDFESVSLLWPRFYDLVNMTINKMITQPALDNGMKQIFQQFWQYRQEDPRKHTTQLNTIAMVRCLSLLVEHVGPIDQHHTTSAEMTPEIAAAIKQQMAMILHDQLYIDL